MDTLREYALQSILGAMQSVVVVYGILATATMMKVYGYPDASIVWRDESLFVRQFGLVLFALPIVWVSVSIFWERHDQTFSKRCTLITGIALLLALVYFLTGAAASPRIHIGEMYMGG